MMNRDPLARQREPHKKQPARQRRVVFCDNTHL